jgi:hypothetical protein
MVDRKRDREIVRWIDKQSDGWIDRYITDR